MRVAPQVVLTEDQERTLRQWARVRSLPARQVERARVVLLAAAGRQDLEIAFEVGISNQKAARWRNVSWKWAWLDWKRMHPAPGARQTSRSDEQFVAQHAGAVLPRSHSEPASPRDLRDVEELIMAIGDYIDKHNGSPKPFVWTAKTVDQRARTVLG